MTRRARHFGQRLEHWSIIARSRRRGLVVCLLWARGAGDSNASAQGREASGVLSKAFRSRRTPPPSNNRSKRPARQLFASRCSPSRCRRPGVREANLCAVTLELWRKADGAQHVQDERVELGVARVAPVQLSHTAQQPGRPFRPRPSSKLGQQEVEQLADAVGTDAEVTGVQPVGAYLGAEEAVKSCARCSFRVAQQLIGPTARKTSAAVSPPRWTSKLFSK